MSQNPDHSENLTALKRIEGQIRGVQKMIEEKEYCVDILNQTQAIIGALATVEDKILGKHLDGCVTDAIRSNSAAQRKQKLNEVMAVIRKFRKGYK